VSTTPAVPNNLFSLEDGEVKSTMRSRLTFIGLVAIGLFSTGCGGDSPTQPDAGAQTPETAASQTANGASLPTASLPGAGESSREPLDIPEPEKGTAEWLIREILVLRAQPLPQSDDPEILAKERQRRNYEIVEMASEASVLAHKKSNGEQLFNAAIHHLLEARLQLALQGGEDEAVALYEDAADLQKLVPDSKAAAEAAFTRAKFANINARRFGAQDRRWLEEFARQARLFATEFPKDEARSTQLLFSAGRTCELHAMNEEATLCYSQIREKYPEHPMADQVTAVLRRLNLAGQPLQLAGPAIDGRYVSIDQYRGRYVLVVFWASNAKPFVDRVETLQMLEAKYSSGGFSIVGVNLDAEEIAVDEFLETHALTWPQIFFAKREERGWKNPIATYYGISRVPTVWLVDRRGTVVDTQVDLAQLDERLKALLAQPAATR
jgi:hypothetical protein